MKLQLTTTRQCLQRPAPASRAEPKEENPLRDYFLPTSPVRSDYAASRGWKMARSFNASMAGYTSTLVALQAAGLSPGPLSFGLAVMLRDGLGKVGKVLATSQAKRADLEPQKLSIQGELLESAGLAAESSLALIPGAFLLVMPPAQLLKASGDGLKRAAEPVLETPQCAPENLGEVRAKNELQETLASAAGGVLAFALDNYALHHFGPAAAPVMVGAALALRYLSMQQYLKHTAAEPLTPRIEEAKCNP